MRPEGVGGSWTYCFIYQTFTMLLDHEGFGWKAHEFSLSVIGFGELLKVSEWIRKINLVALWRVSWIEGRDC